MEKITKKQQQIAEFIEGFISSNGYSPSYKEIADHFGVNVNAIQQPVSALIKKGFLEKSAGIARGLRLVPGMWKTGNAEIVHMQSETITIPLYGKVAAGEPIFADNNIESYITVDKPQRGQGELFAVTVTGDSMTDRKIVPHDKLIVRKQNTASEGEIVVALLDDEVTVKVFRKKGDTPYLQPANNMYDPIYRPFTILGVVVGLTRDYTAV